MDWSLFIDLFTNADRFLITIANDYGILIYIIRVRPLLSAVGSSVASGSAAGSSVAAGSAAGSSVASGSTVLYLTDKRSLKHFSSFSVG